MSKEYINKSVKILLKATSVSLPVI